MFRDILLNELEQHWGHLFTLAGSGGFKGIMQTEVHVDVQALQLLVLFGWRLQRFTSLPGGWRPALKNGRRALSRESHSFINEYILI